ncbi:MAG: M6 family metalloprotease domain-containing protein [Nitrospirae bacterium]|nr:M6 family metalloprotease domain-containing protein [Nitrospirota bacterium]
MKKSGLLLLFSVFLLISFISASWAMPPHKLLREEIKKGTKPTPFFLTEPDTFKKMGINQGARRLDGSRVFAPELGPAGDFKALALLVQFTDKPSQVGAVFFDTLIYDTTGSSVRTYYSEVSYGTLNIITVNLPSSTGWSTAPRLYSYYTNNNYGFGNYPRNVQKLVEDVVDIVDPYIDFSQYDNDGDGYVDALFVIHAGPGAEFTGSRNDIWSHQWSINQRLKDGVYIYNYSMEPEYMQTPGDETIGVFSHELGHVFGLPDLYDYGYDSEGAGDWSLMASGSWNYDGIYGHWGNSPAHPDAWSRYQLGFVSPAVISTNSIGVTIPAVETSSSVLYVWDSGSANNEYFLLENRQQTGYDTYLPADGLLIWHIDETMSSNGNDYQCLSHSNCTCSQHYLVALEQADGNLDLENNINYGDAGDSYPGTSNNRTFNLSSTPNSGSYANCSSTVAISNISDSVGVMTADIQVTTPATPSISGTISYSGTKTGTIYVLAYTNRGFLGTPAYSTSLSTPGAYSINNVSSGTYYILSYRDSNGDGKRQPFETYGLYGSPGSPTAVVVSGSSVTGVNITLYDPGSISGTITYSGSSTGTIYIQAYTNPSFTGLPVYTSIISAPGQYQIRGMLPGTYYVRSFRDANGNQRLDIGEPRGRYGTPTGVVVTAGKTTTGINITLY